MAEEFKDQPEMDFRPITQYIKDLSFENVNPVSKLPESDDKPNIKLGLDVNVNPDTTNKDCYTVDLVINVQIKVKDTTLFVLQLDYCGEFFVKAEKNLVDILTNVECPSLLFPFARAIVSKIISEGGFPTLMLAPVNFEELYRHKISTKNKG